MLHVHFSTADKEVQARHKANQLDTKIVCQQQPGDDDDDIHAACSADVYCARTSARETGAVDVHGVVGVVCTHGIPVRGGFCDMLTPEIFSYYLILLHCIIARAQRIRDVYVDFACKLRVTWQRYVTAQQAGGGMSPDVSSALAGVRLVVNWLHAAGHKMECQLQHSGRHTLNAGRRIGEMTEQLWSMVKVSGCMQV
jgi:hypothetical protein